MTKQAAPSITNVTKVLQEVMGKRNVNMALLRTEWGIWEFCWRNNFWYISVKGERNAFVYLLLIHLSVYLSYLIYLSSLIYLPSILCLSPAYHLSIHLSTYLLPISRFVWLYIYLPVISYLSPFIYLSLLVMFIYYPMYPLNAYYLIVV